MYDFVNVVHRRGVLHLFGVVYRESWVGRRFWRVLYPWRLLLLYKKPSHIAHSLLLNASKSSCQVVQSRNKNARPLLTHSLLHHHPLRRPPPPRIPPLPRRPVHQPPRILNRHTPTRLPQPRLLHAFPISPTRAFTPHDPIVAQQPQLFTRVPHGLPLPHEI